MSKQKIANKQAAKKVVFAWTEQAWDDYLHWQKNDSNKMEVINSLLDECRSNPFKGTGKPEPLKGELTGYWSRRIDKEHRLVYLPEDNCIYIIQCRYHY